MVPVPVRASAARIRVPADPLLRPRMLLPRVRRRELPFPFSAPRVQYFFFARNGLYALARHFGLTGADVLFPAYFHGVELEALLAAGARPRFYPVHAGMSVDAEEVVRRIEPSTRAIYVTHFAGFPGPVVELRDVCQERGLLLIEDCALALLSGLGERPLGSFGDAAVFCLYKTLPLPHGGAVALREGSLAYEGHFPSRRSTLAQEVAALLRTYEVSGGPGGHALAQKLRAVGKPVSRRARRGAATPGTDHFELKDAHLLMSPMLRPLLAAQDFERIVRVRRRNYLHLASELRALAPPFSTTLPPGVCPLFYPFVTPDKSAVWQALRERGIQAVDLWRFSHPLVPLGSFPEVDVLRETVLELPCHQDLDSRTIEHLVATVREVVRYLH